MALALDPSGLTIDSYEEVLSRIVAAMRAEFGIKVATALESKFGQLQRVFAELESSEQEFMLQIYAALDPRSAVGVQLDRLANLTGSTRLPATHSTAVGLIRGSEATEVPDGARVQYVDTNGSTWEITGGPHTIPPSGEIECTIQAQETGPIDALTTDQWVILDLVSGWDSFETTADAQVGRNVESDAAFRQRRIVERSAIGSGQLANIRAKVSRVPGVTLVRVYENVNLSTDALGRPGKSIEVLVEGGGDGDVARAIFAGKAGGIQAYGVDVTELVTDSEGSEHAVKFSRIQDVEVWIRCTLTTSTAEQTFPATGAAVVAAELLQYAEENVAGVGQDVTPYRFASAVDDAGLPGVDDVVVEVSTNGSSWQTTKIPISDRERAVYDSSRVEVIEA